jgi:hypothetical protein
VFLLSLWRVCGLGTNGKARNKGHKHHSSLKTENQREEEKEIKRTVGFPIT